MKCLEATQAAFPAPPGFYFYIRNLFEAGLGQAGVRTGAQLGTTLS